MLGGRKPEHFTYELFLDETGQKISKSKGNGLTIDEWLTYAATESLSYFMYQKPKTAKRMYFDVIPKAVDEYHQQLKAYPAQDVDAQVNNPVWHIHHGHPPASHMVVSFAMLLNLASVAGAQDKAGPLGLHPALCAGCLARDTSRSGCGGGLCAALFHRFRGADAGVPRADGQGAGGAGGSAGAAVRAGRAVLTPRRCRRWSSPSAPSTGSSRCATGSPRSTRCCWGESQGPRFGGFIALYGVNETIGADRPGTGGRTGGLTREGAGRGGQGESRAVRRATARDPGSFPGLPAIVPAGQGSSTSAPVVRRDSRSRCASDAWSRRYSVGGSSLTAPDRTTAKNRATCGCRRSGVSV